MHEAIRRMTNMKSLGLLMTKQLESLDLTVYENKSGKNYSVQLLELAADHQSVSCCVPFKLLLFFCAIF